jgi:hypothetical protein
MSDFEVAERLRGVERAVEQSKNILIGLERAEVSLILMLALRVALACANKSAKQHGAP